MRAHQFNRRRLHEPNPRKAGIPPALPSPTPQRLLALLVLMAASVRPSLLSLASMLVAAGSFSVGGFGQSEGFNVDGFSTSGGFAVENEPKLTFTRNAADGTSPLITAAAAADADFIWTGPNGTFTGKQPNISNFPAGDFTLRSTAWDAVTALTFSDRKLAAWDFGGTLAKLTSLTTLFLDINASLVSSFSDWALPDTMTTLYLRENSTMPGDVNSWPAMPNLAILYLRNLPLAIVDMSTVQLGGSVTLARYDGIDAGGASYGTGGAFAAVTKNGATYRINDCVLTETEVDRVLADFVTSGTTGSTLVMGGTNAPPSAAGLANVTTLEGDGWTVTVSS